MNKNNVILVTGATGQQGGAIAWELLAKGYKVRAMTRKPESKPARHLKEKGADVVYGDLEDSDSLKEVLKSVWGVFGVQNTWEAGVTKEEEQGKRLARLAKNAGVQHFVYSSVGSAHRNTGVPHFENKWRVEKTIRQLGFPSYVIIRPVFFMENLLSPWFKPGIEGGNFAIGIRPDTPLQMVAVSDIGKYGLLAFSEFKNLNGRAIDIAGDELTAPEAASILSEVTGREITHYQVPIAEVRSFSEDFAAMLEWFDSVGYNADINGNAKEFSIPPLRFLKWARQQDWQRSKSFA